MPEPAELTAESSRGQRPWAIWAELILIGATALFAIWGLVANHAVAEGCGAHDAWFFATWLYRLVVLFEPSDANLRLGDCFPTVWQLGIARLTGTIAFFLVAAIGLYELLHTQIAAAWIWLRGGHAVVVGFGEIGRVHATNLRRAGHRVVAIDHAPDTVLDAIARRNGILLVRGDARQAKVRASAGLTRAAMIMVATGDDTLNLAVGRSLAAMKKHRTKPREIQVSLDSPLVRRAFFSDQDTGGIELFSVEDAAARLLCRSARVFAIADMLGQHRIHVVFLGFAPVAERVIAHILHGGPIVGFGRPRFSILCPEPEAARRQLRLAYAAVEELADLSFILFDPRQRPFDREPLVSALGRVAPVTAVMVFAAQPKESMPIALALREAMRRGLNWRAPVFFGVDQEALYEAVARRIETTPRLSDVLHAFEISAQLFAQRRAGQPDRLAQTIHDYYRQIALAKIAAGTPGSSAGLNDSLRPWLELAHTYRQANRRVADHLPAKLISAGCYVPRDTIVAPADFAVVSPGPGAELERLSMLEHDSWMIERRLDGWTYGSVRDNLRRIHPDLIDYAELPDGTKDFDRNQIHDLAGQRLLAAQDNMPIRQVRFDLWIGLIGVTALNHTHAAWIDHVLRDNVLPKLLRAHPTHNITVLSPLCPGGDLVMTEAALELLDETKRQHRLVVTEGVPRSAALDEFEAAWSHDSVGYLAAPEHGASNWKDARGMLAKTIDDYEKSPRCEYILELGTGGDDGRRTQNAYLAQRAHVLIVAVDGTPAAPPGSVLEALTWRRDPTAIPPHVAHYAARPNPPATGTSRIIVLDVAQQLVHEEA